jgi:glutamate/tyrosine decarboxylase-like PLP-dependent enzyme
MYRQLADDLAALPALLDRARAAALDHLTRLDATAPARARQPQPIAALPEHGIGASAALDQFRARFGAGMIAAPGPRFWGFVTGGSTPAALIGDWLVSAIDTNAADRGLSDTASVELEAIALLRDLFGLPEAFSGVFVSGATMSNFTALLTAREWAVPGAAAAGLHGMARIPVLAGSAHSSVYKALALSGMGRDSLIALAQQGDGREAVDLEALEAALRGLNGTPAIVVASAGTVNTVDFDDLEAIGVLKARYPFWLHVDAAFGGFAACSPRHAHRMRGITYADSVTIDAHKWLNVPYDSAMVFTRHQATQARVFQNSAAYLAGLSDEPDFLHLTPENSRRWRALPAWFTLMAYGRAGYAEIVERCCDAAATLAAHIDGSAHFRRIAPVHMNVVCFTLAGTPTREQVTDFLARLRDDGEVFLTPTTLNGVPAMRAAFSNWRTTPDDVARGWQALVRIADGISARPTPPAGA